MQDSKFGVKILIGFASIIVVLLGIFIILGVTTKTEYEDFDEITSYQSILDQEEDSYMVYWYGSSCSHCALIKDQVIKFANKNDEDIKVYFINSSYATGVANLEHPTNSELKMEGTPTMLVIKDGLVADLVVGSEDIPELINEINAGEYDILK